MLFYFIAVLDLFCCEQASHCGGSSRYETEALGCRLQQLRCAGSGVVTHGVSGPVARGIFLDQGTNQCPHHKIAWGLG